jgi:chemotaxis protein MotB
MGKKKRTEESSGGGGSWLTTYGDLVTNLLCFFVLLFSMAIVDKQKFEKAALSMRTAFAGPTVGGGDFNVNMGESMISLTPYDNGQEPLDSESGNEGENGSKLGNGAEEGKIGDEGGDTGKGEDQGNTGDEGDKTGKSGEAGTQDEQGKIGDQGNKDGMDKEDGNGEEQGEDSINAFKVDIQGLIDKMGLNENIKVIDEGTLIILRMDSVILFDTGSADLKGSAKPVIEKIGKILKTLDNNIQVQGHADDRPINTREFPSNWELSTKRATNVVKFLIDDCDIDEKYLTATGNTEFKPIVPNDSEYNRQKNRRIDIAIFK